jgi:predicted DNA-binding ribbon-helix-helix protein
MSASRLVNRNVVAERGRTSMRLEPELWDALSEICEREHQDMSTLVRQVEAAGHVGGRTSAVHGPLPRTRFAEMPRTAAA